MLSVDELKSRTYEERMEDVMRELPIRSKEWTNYNASDPGITILENLTAFSALQGAEIVTLSYRARMALLKMAGFVPGRGKCSKVLLSSDDLRKPAVLPPGQRFHLGDLCFETNRELAVGQCRVTGVFTHDGSEFKDCSYVLDRELQVPVKAFGETPKEGNSIYFFPEGHTSKDGLMLEFQPGFLMLAKQCNVPLVPICLDRKIKPFKFARVIVGKPQYIDFSEEGRLREL